MLALILSGAGAFSVDGMLRAKRAASGATPRT
jgi:hypothetical protein